MKKYITIATIIGGFVVSASLFALGANASMTAKMQAARQAFGLASTLNPGESGLESAPLEGKKSGDMLTAQEWNRVLEILSDTSTGGAAAEVVCGGYMEKYSNGYVSGSAWGCASPDSSSVACPSGYVDITSSAPTINLAEQVHLCVLEYAGGGSGGDTPSGAVMAFDLTDCPTGWAPFARGEGRNIIGVGSRGSETYALGDVGGESKHTMTIQELVRHAHTLTHTLHTSSEGRSQTPKGDVEFDKGGAGNIRVQNTGGSQPFNVMDPYVALLYCRKQ